MSCDALYREHANTLIEAYFVETDPGTGAGRYEITVDGGTPINLAGVDGDYGIRLVEAGGVLYAYYQIGDGTLFRWSSIDGGRTWSG